MGATGTGKSTVGSIYVNDVSDPDSVLMVNSKFVECATRQAAQSVGHKLRSCTTDIRTVRITHPGDGRPLLLVDTPGFDDTVKSDVEILIMIADYIVKMCAIQIGRIVSMLTAQ